MRNSLKTIVTIAVILIILSLILPVFASAKELRGVKSEFSFWILGGKTPEVQSAFFKKQLSR
ncbi:MAG: hypothetical protein AAB495_02900 [Patescibacteria group bacterium]